MIEVDKTVNEARIGDQMIVFHCHHYNTFLQQTFHDALGEDFYPIQIDAARNVVEKMMESSVNDKSAEDKKLFAVKYFKKLGFGIINFDSINVNGGIVKLPSSHYANSWYEKFGKSKISVCVFAAGYALGVINKIYSRTFTSSNIKEVECRATNPEIIANCIFEVK